MPVLAPSPPHGACPVASPAQSGFCPLSTALTPLPPAEAALYESPPAAPRKAGSGTVSRHRRLRGPGVRLPRAALPHVLRTRGSAEERAAEHGPHLPGSPHRRAGGVVRPSSRPRHRVRRVPDSGRYVCRSSYPSAVRLAADLTVYLVRIASRVRSRPPGSWQQPGFCRFRPHVIHVAGRVPASAPAGGCLTRPPGATCHVAWRATVCRSRAWSERHARSAPRF